MTAHSCDQRPAVSSEKLQHVTDLHSGHMIGEPIENLKPYNGGVDAAGNNYVADKMSMTSPLVPLASNDLFARPRL